jgi:hypothetical protein
MPRIQFDKDNWTGEKDYINILNDDGKFTIDSHKPTVYRLNRTLCREEGCAKIQGSDWDWLGDEFTLGSVYKDGSMFYATVADIGRSDKSPFIAAAKLLCNII